MWRVLTPGVAGPPRGRAVEAVRRAMESRIDAQRLRDFLPDLANHAKSREREFPALLPTYRRFVSKVAPPAQTMSLEVAAFLSDLCERRRPRRVLELGTGFGTAVLRRRAAAGAFQIFSADDDVQRLGRTRAFLEREGLPTEGLLPWRDFVASHESDFELVVHELDPSAGASLAVVLDRVAAGGFVLLDGAHDPTAERTARRLLTSLGAEQWSLRALTRDCFGRHALLAQR